MGGKVVYMIVAHLCSQVVVCRPEVDPADLEELVADLQAGLPGQAVGRDRGDEDAPVYK